jgi:N-acyl-D-amino-acid deacylase
MVAFGYSPDWGVEVDWSSFGEYHSRLDGTAINVAPLVAQGVIRNMVMGMAARRPTTSELDQMCQVLRRCMEEGAFGLSTGLEYQPGVWTDQEENRRLVAEVGKRGGLYATHMRGRAEDHGNATNEALVTARGTGAHLQLSHFAPRPNAPASASEQAFQLVAEAVENDEPVGVDTFPEIWGPALLIDLFPEWALQGSLEAVRERLRSEKARVELRDHFLRQPEFLARVAGYSEIYVADAPGRPELSGVSLTSLAERDGQDVAGSCCDILLSAEDDYRSVAIRHVYATESDLRRVMELPYCSIESDGVVTAGEGDGCPLIWNASSYGYVPRVIEHYVDGVGLFSLAEAVRRMTSLPADTVGLVGRGTLEVGSYADLVVLDTNELRDLSTPEDPARCPRGVRLVLVNGVKAVIDDRITESRSGRALQR